MEKQIKEIIVVNFKSIFGLEIQDDLIQFQETKKEFQGDLTLVLFPLIKLLRTSPIEVGQKIGDFLKNNISSIRDFNVVSGFLNIVLSENYWIDSLNEIERNVSYGYVDQDSKSTIMVEYSSPNTNKPLHLGHLRNNFLGYSVSEILKANGYKVIKTQIVNDRGIHICKSMVAWNNFSPLNEKGEKETPENTGVKGDKLVGKYYVEFEKHLNVEIDSIISSWKSGDFQGFNKEIITEYTRLIKSINKEDGKSISKIDSKIEDLARSNSSLMFEAKEMLRKWENKDPEVYLLWSKMNGWVYAGFDITYKSMGVDFDKIYYESDTFILGKDLVFEGLKNGVFYKKNDGSVWIDLSEYGLDQKLVLRSDGTAVYVTQDVGTAVDRYRDYIDLDRIVYTVGNEQDYHFKVLFLILEKLGYTWAKKCFHLSYGMVDLPTGKMKSREGTIVDADELIEDVINNAKEITQERGHIGDMNDDEKNELFHLIGMGGLKYYLLKVDPKKRMMFNPEDSIELNGNTGPFIQYTHARIKSMLRKVNHFDQIKYVSILSEEKEIIKQLLKFPSVIKEAGENYSPALIANYTYELVKSYNSFYQAIPILIEKNLEIKNMRLVLSKNVAKVIYLAMRLLGVQVPERM
ncbi:MAG: arginine--tRNA ligase [Crocinitomicaceae bacterium]|nr:arginine--tRNA ligase [Crocinitomicaceae bacterium]|tara:strand:+ start:65061 stop:66956 length:1896 start_codon:yes stop_codon:yes gene_type:complete